MERLKINKKITGAISGYFLLHALSYLSAFDTIADAMSMIKNAAILFMLTVLVPVKLKIFI